MSLIALLQAADEILIALPDPTTSIVVVICLVIGCIGGMINALGLTPKEGADFVTLGMRAEAIFIGVIGGFVGGVVSMVFMRSTNPWLIWLFALAGGLSGKTVINSLVSALTNIIINAAGRGNNGKDK